MYNGESPEAFLRAMDTLEHTAKAAKKLRKLGYAEEASRVEALYEQELGITVSQRAAVRKQLRAVVGQNEAVSG